MQRDHHEKRRRSGRQHGRLYTTMVGPQKGRSTEADGIDSTEGGSCQRVSFLGHMISHVVLNAKMKFQRLHVLALSFT